MHCKEGLKEVSMATLRSLVVSTKATGVPTAKVRAVVVGWPMGRWLHLLGLSGRSHVIDQSHAERRLISVLLYWERGAIILTISAKSRTLPRCRSGRSLANSRSRRGLMTDPWEIPVPALRGTEKASCTRTLKELCVRHERTHSMIFG